MERKVLDYIKKHQMITAGDRLVAGISGGVDSVCLLFMLLYCQKQIPFTWTAVHVNHRIRGEEAKRDQQFVETLCREHGIPCRVFEENVEAFAKEKKLSVEEAGRTVRQRCFQTVMEETGAIKIFLAHHQNDNAETMLLNLARGTGLNGLGGIRPVNGNCFRPLLCVDRREIERWSKTAEVQWCEDSTNQGDHYVRNRIRNHVLPYLEREVNAGTVLHLQEVSEQMQELKSYVDEQTAEAERQAVRVIRSENAADGTDRPERLLILEKPMKALHPFLQKELWRKELIRTAGREKDMSRQHIEALEGLLEKQSGRRVELPYGVEAVRCPEGVFLQKTQKRGKGKARSPQRDTQKEECKEILLCVSGKTEIPWAKTELRCTLAEEKADFFAEQLHPSPYTKWFDYDIMKNGLTVRTRRPGDFLVIDEKGSRQKLKAWFINEKIPSEERDRIPLLADGSEILWVLGYRRSSARFVKDTTRRLLRIEFNGGKEIWRKQ